MNHGWRLETGYAALCGNARVGDALCDRDADVGCAACRDAIEAYAHRDIKPENLAREEVGSDASQVA